MRVAVAQYAVGAELDANLAASLRMVGQVAAACRPDLIVLPEFCNHVSWYEDPAHCWSVALDPEGDWLSAIARKAAESGAYVVVNCTLRRGKFEQGGVCTGASLLYSPDGELAASNDKQVLIGHENDFLAQAWQPGPVVATKFGRLGLYACMDGVINETPRCLALRGAQLLCNSLNSFASDEAGLHVPVRAAENKVFVAAANKTGPLIPEALLEPVSQQTGIPEKFLMGAGESQVVAPDGAVLARASRDREEAVWADIDLAEADDKRRPDGSDIFQSRRPALYAALGEDPARQPLRFEGEDTAAATLIQLTSVGPGATAEAGAKLGEAFAGGARLAALPPLFFLQDQQVVDPKAAAGQAAAVIRTMAASCGPGQYAATSLVLGEPLRLATVLIGNQGVVLEQGQLHRSERFAWSALCDEVSTANLGFSRVALLSSDDSCFPESFRLAALASADTVIVPVLPQEAWELRTGLLERAAENRVNLLAAMQPGPLGRSFGASLPKDFTLLTPWEEREFDGVLSQPPVTTAGPGPGLVRFQIYPRQAENKVVSRGTDLLAGRPWRLLAPLCASA